VLLRETRLQLAVVVRDSPEGRLFSGEGGDSERTHRPTASRAHTAPYGMLIRGTKHLHAYALHHQQGSHYEASLRLKGLGIQPKCACHAL
jgi:hypothetical protein